MKWLWPYLAVAVLAVASLRAQSAPAIDHHQHLFSPATAALAPGLETVFADDLVKLLDQAGIQRAVILSTAYQFGNPNRPAVDDEYGKVRAENDWTSREVARFPDRLRGFLRSQPTERVCSRRADALRERPAPPFWAETAFRQLGRQLGRRPAGRSTARGLSSGEHEPNGHRRAHALVSDKGTTLRCRSGSSVSGQRCPCGSRCANTDRASYWRGRIRSGD